MGSLISSSANSDSQTKQPEAASKKFHFPAAWAFGWVRKAGSEPSARHGGMDSLCPRLGRDAAGVPGQTGAGGFALHFLCVSLGRSRARTLCFAAIQVIQVAVPSALVWASENGAQRAIPTDQIEVLPLVRRSGRSRTTCPVRSATMLSLCLRVGEINVE